jgi:putative ABC transport system permease protein
VRSLLDDGREVCRIALEALGRYKLRTSLSVLGIVLGVAAVIAMMSVSEGAARQALAQVESLGMDNLVLRSHSSSQGAAASQSLQAGDADWMPALVPAVTTSSPLIERYVRLTQGDKTAMGRMLGVRPSFQTILRIPIQRGRFLTATDDHASAQVCVLGSSMARRLFGHRQPVGERIRAGQHYYHVVGVLKPHGSDSSSGSALAWHDLNESVIVPFTALSKRTVLIAPEQPADEIWLQVEDGERIDELAQIVQHSLSRLNRRDFNIVVPRELLAQRYRTQRTFSVVVGSVAVLALLVGGIGIMNIMLTSVVERTHEIGIRRTVGATRRAISIQFLAESLMMTVGGGFVGIVLGAAVSWGITAYAVWPTYISPVAIVVAFVVSFATGIIFGLYPAVKAAHLEPVDAVRYE